MIRMIFSTLLALACAVPAITHAGQITIQTPSHEHVITGSWDMQTLAGAGSFYVFATNVSTTASPSSFRPAGYKNFHGQVTLNGGNTNVGFQACILTESDHDEDGTPAPIAEFWCGTQTSPF